MKNQSVETKELVQFITQQSAAEIKQVQEKTELEKKVASLTAERDSLQAQLDQLKADIAKLEAEIEAQKLKEAELAKDLAKAQEQAAGIFLNAIKINSIQEYVIFYISHENKNELFLYIKHAVYSQHHIDIPLFCIILNS